MTGTCVCSIDKLLSDQSDLLKGRRVAVLSHQAAVDSSGIPTANRLHQASHVDLCMLLGPEHGYFGKAGAGELVSSTLHPEWNIQVSSLYTEAREPSEEILSQLDTIVFDLSNIAVRAYTYLSTLARLLRALHNRPIELIILDRPIPYASVCDGPMRDKGFDSFVCDVDVPFVYGLTACEAARYIISRESLSVKWHRIHMDGYKRLHTPDEKWPAWQSPSPAITSPAAALSYPVTLFTEGLPFLDCDRRGSEPFQVLAHPELNPSLLQRSLENCSALPGIHLGERTYFSQTHDREVEGLTIHIHDEERARPASFSIHLINAIQQQLSADKIWTHEKTRPDFFDLLYGTSATRKALRQSQAPDEITAAWAADLETYQSDRKEHLLYDLPS